MSRRKGVAPLRLLRGGSWNNNATNVRSANRNRNTPDNRNNNIGFRVVAVR
ncbi:MAG: SUMF1/EgtB/PvdO family nonheme iron enzyme [Pyrinomonadaceae bacterium]